MTDKEREIERLTAPPFGFGREEAERMLLDDDLWLPNRAGRGILMERSPGPFS